MTKTFWGIGSNIGNREKNFEEALHQLANFPKLEVIRKSKIYETEPVGYRQQPTFLNAAVEISTSLKPLDLLHIALQIERRMGRERSLVWGPRKIDLDILLVDAEQISAEHLVVPHPRLHERKFVLIPLMELIPNFVVPGFRKSIRTLLNRCQDQSLVIPYAPSQINWETSISES